MSHISFNEMCVHRPIYFICVFSFLLLRWTAKYSWRFDRMLTGSLNQTEKLDCHSVCPTFSSICLSKLYDWTQMTVSEWQFMWWHRIVFLPHLIRLLLSAFLRFSTECSKFIFNRFAICCKQRKLHISRYQRWHWQGVGTIFFSSSMGTSNQVRLSATYNL